MSSTVDPRSMITLVGQNAGELPSSSIIHYAQSLCENYAKLAILEQFFCLAMEYPESAFLLESSSYPLLPQKDKDYKAETEFKVAESLVAQPLAPLSIDDEKKWHILHGLEEKRHMPVIVAAEHRIEDVKKKNPIEAFFQSLYRRSRPVVYHQVEDKLNLLYSYNGPHAIKLTKLVYECPPEFSFLAIPSLIRDLLGVGFDCKRDKRETEAHEWTREKHEWDRQEHELKKELLVARVDYYKLMGRSYQTRNSLVVPVSDETLFFANECQNKVIKRQMTLNSAYDMVLRKEIHFEDRA